MAATAAEHLTTPTADERDGNDLAARLEAAVDHVAAGWDPERRAALWVELRRQLARESPGNLAAALDAGTVQTTALQLIDAAMVDVDEGRCSRLVIALPPQEGKSTRVARYGALWALIRNPERRVAIASYAVELAAGHGRFVRDLIETHGLDAPASGGIDLLGLRVQRGSRAASRWDLAGHRGGLYAVGIGGGLTGKPVDWMVIDDPFKDRAEADSLVRRNAVWEWWTNVVIPRLAPGAPVILIMTRWHEDDLVGRLEEEDRTKPEAEREWRILTIPAQCEDAVTDPLGRAVGEFLQSARRRTVEQWQRIKGSVGARVWAALYQGHPTPSEGGMFKWDWIRPYRIGRDDLPQLQRVVVAVDTTGGGNDEAGVVGAGRDATGRVFMVADRSGAYTAGGQWRQAWLAVLDLEADVLVYERNLVDPIMRKAIASSWRRMVDQAQALQAAGALDPEPIDPDALDSRVAAAAAAIARTGDDDVLSSTDPLAALTAQLLQLLPYATRILEAPRNGPARVEGVSATRGKATRAEPMSQAYETGQVSHVGALPALEQELVTWQEGQASPNRLDAAVWAWTHLQSSGPAQMSSPRGVARVPTGPRARSGPRFARGR